MEPLKSQLRVNPLNSGSGKKDYINHSISSEPKYGILFSDFISTLVVKRRRLNRSSKDNYKTLLYNLALFCEDNNAILYTNSIGEEFLDDFILFLESRQLKKGYIASTISVVQGLVSKAHKLGYAIDLSYGEVAFDGEATESVYLSMNEITRVYYFSDLTRLQKRIRDLFVIGCLTGLRFSDFSTLAPENFSDNYITKITKKTNTRVVIPIHDYVREIHQRYNGRVPSHFTNQYFNRAIKKICRKVGLNEAIIFHYTRGGKLVSETKQKWQLISSHTARRSAATNMYLTGRMKTYEIMNITGHTTESSFFRYIKVTKEDVSKQISGDIFFKK